MQPAIFDLDRRSISRDRNLFGSTRSISWFHKGIETSEAEPALVTAVYISTIVQKSLLKELELLTTVILKLRTLFVNRFFHFGHS